MPNACDYGLLCNLVFVSIANIGISSIYASKPPCSSYNKSIGFFSDKEASDYEQNLARLILANTAMRNSTNPDTTETVELAKKEIAKKVSLCLIFVGSLLTSQIAFLYF